MIGFCITTVVDFIWIILRRIPTINSFVGKNQCLNERQIDLRSVNPRNRMKFFVYFLHVSFLSRGLNSKMEHARLENVSLAQAPNKFLAQFA